MTAEVQCWCRHCKKELPPSHTGPCPHCGKTGKDCKVTATATVGISGSLRARKKRKGVGRFVKEILQGWFPSGDPKLKNGVDIVRIVDKEKHEFHHIVKDVATGEVTHEEHEPLEQHKHQRRQPPKNVGKTQATKG
jgi:hypothetical protein